MKSLLIGISFFSFLFFSPSAYAAVNCPEEGDLLDGSKYVLNVEDCTNLNELGSADIQAIFDYANGLPGSRMVALTFPEDINYVIGETIYLYLKRTMVVDATNATFESAEYDAAVEDYLDGRYTYGNLFDFFAADDPSNKKLAFIWRGGLFDLSNRKVSTSVGWPCNTENECMGRYMNTNISAVTPWTDAMSFNFGKRVPEDSSDNMDEEYACYNEFAASNVRELVVTGITVKGTVNGGGWRKAGGDSGLFISGSCKTVVSHSTFDAIRDAAIYLSEYIDLDTLNAMGEHPISYSPMIISGSEDKATYLIKDLTISNSAGGIASKRGLDNVTIKDNQIFNTEIAIGINDLGRDIAENVEISNNLIDGAWHGIRAEWLVASKITGNTMTNLGLNDPPSPTFTPRFPPIGIRITDPDPSEYGHCAEPDTVPNNKKCPILNGEDILSGELIFNEETNSNEIVSMTIIEGNTISAQSMHPFYDYSFNGYHVRSGN